MAAVLAGAGDALFANLGYLFAVGLAFGFAKKGDGSAALAGLVGYLVLLGSLWALWYHFLAGVRHLCYDAGLLMTRHEAHRASWVLIIGSVVLTLLTAILFAI